MILAGDVGGTKTILALYKLDGVTWKCYKKEQYSSHGFGEFKDLLHAFLEGENVKLQSVCIGVAGPIVNGDCIATNLPWVLRQQDIAEQAGVKHVQLLNDLEATAWGVLSLESCDFVELNPNAKKEKGNVAILAAGTGLGEALVVWSDEKYHVVATEGGHTDYAPRNELEIGLLRFLLAKYPEHVSYERVVCGQGLIDIYKYLKSIAYAPIDLKVEESISGAADTAAEIGKKGSVITEKAVAMFCEIYGAEAGNLALKLLPKAGVVLAGGIAAKNLASMTAGDFMKGFVSKGRYCTALESISVKVCLNAEAALLGALTVAKSREKRAK